jgi:hypothetical protein
MWQGCSPSATRNFITERCFSNKESMIDEAPIIYQRAKYCVYTTISENKLTTLLANECSFHQYTCIMCVYSCTWKERSMKSPDIF